MRHIQERKLQTFLIRKLLLHSLSSAYFTHTYTTHVHWQTLLTLISMIHSLSSAYFTHTHTTHGHCQTFLTLISIIHSLSSAYFTRTHTTHIQRLMYFTFALQYIYFKVHLCTLQLIFVTHCHQRLVNSPMSDDFTHTCQHTSLSLNILPTMDEWTIKTQNPICRLFFQLTEFAAFCLTDFIDWRYIHSWFVFSTQLVNCCSHGRRNYMLLLSLYCTFSMTSSPSPPSQCTVYTDSVRLVGGWWGGVEMYEYCGPYSAGVLHSVSDQIQNLQIASPPQTIMTSKDDIKGLVSLKFLRPCFPHNPQHITLTILGTSTS